MSAPVRHGEPAAARAVRLLRRLAAGALLALVLLGAPFVLGYRSADPAIGPWTGRYLAGVVIPFLGAACTALALAAGAFRLPGGGSGAGEGARGGRRPPRAVALAAAALGAVAASAYALSISDEYVSVLAFLLALPMIGILWDRVLEDPDPLLPSLAFLAAGVVLFGVEISGLLVPGLFGDPERTGEGGRPALSLAIWGDTSTFATLFPKEPPFIGPGGRLRPGLDVRMRAPEYRAGARLVTNSRGFRNDREFSPRPEPGDLRILSLGDSFSTGFCADQGAFFGSLLEADLRERLAGRRLHVMNAEVSDPAYGLRYLQEHGMGYHPDLVLYGLSGNDIMQAEQFFGGDRLFTFDGSGRLIPNPSSDPSVRSAWERYRDFAYPAAGNPGPGGPGLPEEILKRLIRFRTLEWLAALAAEEGGRPVDMPSYAGPIEVTDGRKRLVDGGPNLGFFYRGDAEPVDRMYEAFEALLGGMERAAREGGARLVLVIHPQRFQVQPGDWEAIRERWNLDEADFDLRLANRRIGRIASGLGVPVCDLTEAFETAARERNLYLPGGDTHYNRAGHRVAGLEAADCLEGLGIR